MKEVFSNFFFKEKSPKKFSGSSNSRKTPSKWKMKNIHQTPWVTLHLCAGRCSISSPRHLAALDRLPHQRWLVDLGDFSRQWQGFFFWGGTTSKRAKCSTTFPKWQELNLMIRNDSMMFPLLSEFGLRYQLLHQWSCVPFKKLLFNDSNRGYPKWAAYFAKSWPSLSMIPFGLMQIFFCSPPRFKGKILRFLFGRLRCWVAVLIALSMVIRKLDLQNEIQEDYVPVRGVSFQC